MAKSIKRCDWCGDDDLYVAYHDQEWGMPSRDDATLFEFLVLEGAQAGLSWITVLRKRENYRAAFDGFDPDLIARYGKRKVNQLLKNEGIIRNQLKINSAVTNAQRFVAMRDAGQSFSDFVWSFVDHVPVQNRYRTMADVPATTPVSDAMSKALKKAGFSFVGSTICYAYMQSIGMVNDHLVTCHRHKACQEIGRVK